MTSINDTYDDNVYSELDELEDTDEFEFDDYDDLDELDDYDDSDDDDDEYDIPDEVLEFIAYLKDAVNQLIESSENVIKRRAARADVYCDLDLTCERYRGQIEAYKTILDLISFE